MNDYMKKINLSSISNRIERNKAKTFNDFIDLLNKEKYILNSKFKGMLINVNLICPNGCSYSVKPNNFKNLGQRCPCRVPKYQQKLNDKFGNVYKLINLEKNIATVIHTECDTNNKFIIPISSLLKRKTVFCDNCKYEKDNNKIYVSKRLLSCYNKYFEFLSKEGKETYNLKCRKCGHKFSRAESTLRDALDRGNRSHCPNCEPYKAKNESKQASYIKYILKYYFKGICKCEEKVKVLINGKIRTLSADIVLHQPVNLHIEVNGSQHNSDDSLYSTDQVLYSKKVEYFQNKKYKLVELEITDYFSTDIENFDYFIKELCHNHDISYHDYDIVKSDALKYCYMTKHEYAYEKRYDILNMYENELATINDISKKFNIKSQIISEILIHVFNIKITSPSNRILDKYSNEISNDYTNGSTWNEICSRYNISVATLRKFIIENNLEKDNKLVLLSLNSSPQFYKDMPHFCKENNIKGNYAIPKEYKYFRNTLNAFLINIDYYNNLTPGEKSKMINIMKDRNKRLEKNKTINHRNPNIKVAQIDIHTNKVLTLFDSVKDAKKAIGVSTISDCLQGKQKTSGGYKWSYVDITNL